MIVLDTHVWLWWLLGEEALTDEERETLDEAAARKDIAISAASIWEVELLERKGIIQLQPNIRRWIDLATKPEICKVIPIEKEVILAQEKLPDNFPDDPADRLIVATALHYQYGLATKDKKLQKLGF
jgi:PIN domain nuclease of toxin-antitoxin system